MIHKSFDGVGVIVACDDTFTDDEIRYVINQQKEKYPNRDIESIDITVVDDAFIEVETHFKPEPKFDRIRRITGYLVGTLDRFNDGKRSEVEDRVKHNAPSAED